MLNFSESCERNKHPILAQLITLLSDCRSVLEIGSHSGQHAFHFAQHLPQLNWQLSDRALGIEALSHNQNQADLSNVLAPITLDVANPTDWPQQKYTAIYSANTLHIMSVDHVKAFFNNLPKVCQSNTILVIYGPFNYQGKYSSDSNETFEQWLKNRDPLSGIRDFEWVNELATAAGFLFEADIDMPANNQLLVWRMS
ncbi:DUF938 domain-containing protein [Thalassotalea profundi]|uniref:Methylase n=1 Tax=Thalassotalea profundi TaxID=2036687 RepID=A0ABQ3IPJ3_9GAMM|nr:DUF938 domain-containing protein [Thalassotalea profundi]GHE89868.1 methylase [Thalassotalea profundi]